jgi:site-specific DNA-methyltransferase (adenine-specific)
MPNTFAMAPGYVRKYIARERLVAPDVNIFAMLRVRADRYELPAQSILTGRSWLHDATRTVPREVRKAKPRLVFTSPPYLQVIKYGKYNWVRLWFLKKDAKQVDAGLMSSGSLTHYLDFMSDVLASLRRTVAADGFVCLVIGDVRRGDMELNLARKVWRHAADPYGWHCHGIIADGLPTGHKVSRIWKTNPGRATKTDRLLMLSPSAEVSLPPLMAIDWQETPTFANLVQPGGVND